MWENFGCSWPLAGFLTLFTAGLAICYDVSPAFKYHFKFCIYIISVTTVGIFTIPFIILRPKDPRNVLIPMAVARTVANALLGITWEVQGAEHLDKDFACVIVCNHQSILDFLGLGAVWPAMKKCVAVAKRELLYIPVFGQYAWLCGTVFIDRANPADSRDKIKETAEIAKKNNLKLWIFPEGHRHKGHSLLPFKKGAFYIAKNVQLPIVPVVISPYTFVDDDKKTFDNGKVIVKVLPPIEPSEFGSDDVQALAARTSKIMQAEFDKLSELVSGKPPRTRNQTIFSASFNPTPSSSS